MTGNDTPQTTGDESAVLEATVVADEQGLLFDDELSPVAGDVGYRGPTACNAAGITYRQLDYWARTGLVEPTVRGATGSGTQRLYSFRDILLLKVIKRLLDTGISLQQIRIAVQHLRERGTDDLTRVTLMSDGASVYECTSDARSSIFCKVVRASSASPSVASGARSRARCPSCRVSGPAPKKTSRATSSLPAARPAVRADLTSQNSVEPVPGKAPARCISTSCHLTRLEP